MSICDISVCNPHLRQLFNLGKTIETRQEIKHLQSTKDEFGNIIFAGNTRENIGSLSVYEI